MEPRERKFFIGFLLVFFLLAFGFLFTPGFPSKGWKLTLIVLSFYILISFFIFRFSLNGWKDLLYYCTIASLFQIFPDWFLAEVLGTLVFPEESFFLVGKVPFYMAGMWTIPFFMLLYASRSLLVLFPRIPFPVHFWAGILGLLIFWISEETMHLIPVWYAQNVRLVGSSAIYVLPAEFLLGVYVSWSYETSKNQPIINRAILATSVFLFYTGALGFSYLLIERIF